MCALLVLVLLYCQFLMVSSNMLICLFCILFKNKSNDLKYDQLELSIQLPIQTDNQLSTLLPIIPLLLSLTYRQPNNLIIIQLIYKSSISSPHFFKLSHYFSPLLIASPNNLIIIQLIYKSSQPIRYASTFPIGRVHTFQQYYHSTIQNDSLILKSIRYL